MAEPNYMAYAQYMGARNPIADGINQLGGTLSDIGKMNMERENQSRRNSLADLQIQQQGLALQEAQRMAGQKEQLRNTLSNLQPATTTREVPNPLAGQTVGPRVQPQFDPMTPSAMQQPELSMAPSTTQPQTMQQTTTTPADPMKAIFDHAMKTGALDVAKQAIDMQTLIRNSTPDKLKQAEQIKELGTFTAALKHVKEIKQAGMLNQNMLDGILAMMPESIQVKFPNGLKQSDIGTGGGLEVKDAQGNVIAHWAVSPDGTKTELIKAAQDTKGFDTIDLGDKVKVVDRATGKVTYEKKALSPAAQVKITQGGESKGDLEERKIALRELPVLRKDAESAKLAYPRINRMLEIIDNGNAGGITATMKQWLAPYAPESKSMNEAALFQTFARMVSGPQRVNIIGPGPQTEAEGRLLAQVGGGGTQGRAALRELLNMHKEAYSAKRDEYNQMLEAAKTKIYKPISFGNDTGKTAQPKTSGRFTVVALPEGQ